jgi:crossover junction endodeoxyribonuclease RuvC
MTIIIGIDPGLDGALAVLTHGGELIEIHDMPTLLDGAKGRRAVNPALFASIIYSTQATRAYCELIGPRPTDGTTGAFGFGRTRGIIEGVLAAAGVPLAMIAPPSWKRVAGIAPGKENKDSARSVAISRWPSQAALFARKCDCDRAEAALIGVAGLMRVGALHAQAPPHGEARS